MKHTATTASAAALIAVLSYSGVVGAQPISQPAAKVTVRQLAAQVAVLQATISWLQATVTSLQNQLSSQNAQNAFALGKFMTADANGNIGIGTMVPLRSVRLAGDLPRNLGMDPNPAPGGVGNALMINAGASAVGSTDLQGGDLVLAAGTGTGLGGSGNARIQTAGGEDSSGMTGNTLVDREIVIGKAK
jgi:hypothetical protein